MQPFLKKRERERVAKLSVSYLSPAHRTKLKCAKMRCYYKELHEREQQAKTRNLELLGNVENLASKMKEFSIDCSRLLQKRVTTLGSFICPNIHHMHFLKQYWLCVYCCFTVFIIEDVRLICFRANTSNQTVALAAQPVFCLLFYFCYSHVRPRLCFSDCIREMRCEVLCVILTMICSDPNDSCSGAKILV